VAQGQAHDERERQRGLTRIQAVDEARKQAEAGFANSPWDLPGPSNHAQAPRFAGFGMLLSPEPFRCGGEQPAASAQLWPDDLLFDDLPLPNLQLFADAPARHEVAAAPQPRRPHHVPESIGVDLRRRPHAMMPPRTYTHRASRPGGPI
jgi:hypothetical protein